MTSVTFVATGALQQLPACAVLTDSRLGTYFIVLFIGFVYVLHGHEKRVGLTMGLVGSAHDCGFTQAKAER